MTQFEVPVVSIVMPCRNERRYIQMAVESLLRQDFTTGALELLVVDGLSQDGTRDILSAIAHADSRVRIIDNPKRTTPCALNAGILAARGEYVAILGAHSEYATGYLRACVEVLERDLVVACAGGPINSRGKSDFGRAVAAAMSHPVGIGNARHRQPQYEGYAEGACYPVFRRAVFQEIGMYDEALIRNQDDELNYRLNKAGWKVFLTSRAQCTYFVRDTAKALFRQYFEYGYWRVAVLKKHGRPASLRQLVPATFLGGLISSFAFAWLGPDSLRVAALAPAMSYMLLLLGAGALQGLKQGGKVGLLFPLAASIMHFAYAAGFGWGAIKNALKPTSPVSPSNSDELRNLR
ncbi:MAG: glycosyltransferase family 2 protein [Nitrospira sp.]|nr:glycosyltransferase family 2 protein [Nitrospira sp.]